MDLSTLVAHWSGRLPPGFVLPAIAESLPNVSPHPLHAQGGDQEGRNPGQVVPTMPGPQIRQLPTKTSGAGGGRRLPQVRVPQTGHTAINVLI